MNVTQQKYLIERKNKIKTSHRISLKPFEKPREVLDAEEIVSNFKKEVDKKAKEFYSAIDKEENIVDEAIQFGDVEKALEAIHKFETTNFNSY